MLSVSRCIIISCFILSHLITGLQAPNITLTAEGTAETGSNDYSLLCVITIPSTISNHATPTISWRLPSGTILSSDQDFTRLPFTPLTSQAEGNYTCIAYYTVGGVRSPEASKDYHVTVQTTAPTDDVSVSVIRSPSMLASKNLLVTVLPSAPTSEVSVSVIGSQSMLVSVSICTCHDIDLALYMYTEL